VELHDVEIVGLHSHKTLFDTCHDVVAGEDVLPPLAARCGRCPDQAAAAWASVMSRARGAPRSSIAPYPMVVTCSPVRPSSRFATAIPVLHSHDQFDVRSSTSIGRMAISDAQGFLPARRRQRGAARGLGGVFCFW
jgi:hypothetical protein